MDTTEKEATLQDFFTELSRAWPMSAPVPTRTEVVQAWDRLRFPWTGIVQVEDGTLRALTTSILMHRQGLTADALGGKVVEVHAPEEMPERLSPALAFDMGRRSIHLERSEGVEQHLAEQRQVYMETLQANPQLLVQALIDRDRVIAQMGRMMADGRAGTGLLREFVRGAMYLADRGSPEEVQKYLEATFGPGVKADARQIRMHGHTLGPSMEQRLDPAQTAIDTASTAPKGQVEE